MEFLKKIYGNKFIRNVSTLALGTVLSQMILVLSSPLLSRVYTPHQFGNLSLFTSISVLLAIVLSGRYELTVVLPKEDNDAKKLVHLVLLVSSITVTFVLSIIYLLNEIFHFFNFLNIYYILPFHILFIINNSALLYWANRKKEYKKISISTAVMIISNVVFSILFGFLKLEDGLILGLFLGVILSYLYLYFTLNGQYIYSGINLTEVKNKMIKYINFPKYTIISDFGTNITQQYLPIVFSYFYTSQVAGWFSMANRILRIPNIVITSSISNVFRNDAIDAIRENGNCEYLYKSTLKKLVIISFSIYILVFFLSPFLFTNVFGEKWKMSGYYAKILSLMLFFEFFTIPFNSLFFIVNKQKLYMFIQSINTIITISVVVLLSILHKSTEIILIASSFISVIFSIIYLYNSYKISKGVK